MSRFEDFDPMVTAMHVPLLQEASQFVDPAIYNEQLNNRLQIEQAISMQTRATSHNSWSSSGGDYRIFDSSASKFIDMESPLAGPREEVWKKHIDRLLSQNKNKRPTIFLEFGAGFGVSLTRAGKEYATAVESGKLILAATNLGYTPTSSEGTSGYYGVAKDMAAENEFYDTTVWDNKELDFMQANQHRIQFLDVNALQLPTAAIATTKGETIPLRGNTSFITEENALMHSHIPDVTLGVLSQLLIPGGALAVHALEPHYMHRPSWDRLQLPNGRTVEANDDLWNQRGTALAVGHLLIQKHFGMRALPKEDKLLSPLVYLKGRPGRARRFGFWS